MMLVDRGRPDGGLVSGGPDGGLVTGDPGDS